MSIISSSKLIVLNSLHAIRKNGTYLSDVAFPFSGVYRRTDDTILAQISVQSAQICCSFYIVNYSCNILNYTFNGTPFILTMPVGNYNANTFITEILHQFFLNGHIFTVTVNRQTSRLLFYSSGASFVFDASSTMSIVLGLGETNLTSSLSTIECPVAMNLLGITKIQVNSQLLQVAGFDSNNGCGRTSILASIPVSVGSFGLLTYTPPTGNLGELNEITVDQIDIQLVDQNGSLINFNDIHWSITLSLVVSKMYSPLNRIIVGTDTLDNTDIVSEEPDEPDDTPDKPDETVNQPDNEPDIVSDNTLDGMF